MTHTGQILCIRPPTFRGAEVFNESWHPLAVGVVCYDVLHLGHRYLLVSELVLLPPNLTVESLVFGVASLNGL